MNSDIVKKYTFSHGFTYIYYPTQHQSLEGYNGVMSINIHDISKLNLHMELGEVGATISDLHAGHNFSTLVCGYDFVVISTVDIGNSVELDIKRVFYEE